MCWSLLPHVRFLILLTVFELLQKTCNFTICSIFSNSGHVGWCTASPDTILTLDTLVMIQTKFGFHWSSTFRGEDFWKSLRRTTDDGRRRRTPSDGSGELKRETERGCGLPSLYKAYQHSFIRLSNVINQYIGVKPLIHQSVLGTYTKVSVVPFQEKSSFHFVVLWKLLNGMD